MSGFNFGQIGDIVSNVMDTDYIDVKRDMGGVLKEVYSNIKCHVDIVTTDNPDPVTIDVKPIVQSLSVHLPLWADVRNDDYIVAKKCDTNGNIIGVYAGRCGNPETVQSRKKISVQMQSSGAGEPTPTPPEKYSVVTVYCRFGDTDLQDAVEYMAAYDAPFELKAPVIEGYSCAGAYVDDVFTGDDTATIETVTDGEYKVEFIYEMTMSPEYFRFLVNGLYARDDGSLANGWHLYGKVAVESFEQNDGMFRIECANVSLTHEETSQMLFITPHTDIVLMPGNVFVTVESVSGRENGIAFDARVFEPSSGQKGAYIAGYYDG